MTARQMPAFPVGAVYFRKTDPPPADWARDYATARADGMNTFRHWFLWSAIETAPDTFDWADYDRQLDLAAAHGMRTIIAEFITAAPEWAYHDYAHARFQDERNLPVNAQMGGSSNTGGLPGLCLDHDDWRAHAGQFLTTLATRYRGHPGLGGYDIWNEVNANPNFCYCPASIARFRDWLQAKYGTLEELGRVWGRFSFGSWANVTPPRTPGPYADTLDWSEFRADRAHELMRWRRDTIRAADPDTFITAHGLAATFTAMASSSTDDWRAAAEVETYGVTWGSSRHGDEPWKQMQAFDLIRAASRGKPFWHAEAYGGPLWLTPQVAGRPRDDGRIATPDDIRYWSLVSFMAGATGQMYLRWRPLLGGPLFGAFGPYGMDGSRTDRSASVSAIAQWATDPAQGDLWAARPVRGEVGIVYAPEAARFLWAQQQGTSRTIQSIWERPPTYGRAMQGAYRAFWASNVQADWVHVDDIAAYDVLYLPAPVLLHPATVARLRAWVEAGGTLIAEGCPAYWGEHGRVDTTQPGSGLGDLFGARQASVEFAPDLLTDERVTVPGGSVVAGLFRQAYIPAGGVAAGHWADGSVAAVDHAVGRGRTRLVGTMPGYGYFDRSPDLATEGYFAELAGSGPDGAGRRITVSDPRVKARLHVGDGTRFLWVANPVREPIAVTVTLGDALAPVTAATTRWGASPTVAGRTVTLTVGARDVAVLALA